jgi:hypothetical protein
MSKSEEVVKTIDTQLSILQDKKAATMLAQGRSASYVKDRVFKYRKIWWDKWKEMLNSSDLATQKTALIEYNKLQARVLPTQLEGTNGSNIMVNIIGMGVDNTHEEEPQQPNVIQGEIIEEGQEEDNG